ncbi:MAG: hypothetical protein QOH46_2643, partial [Solirubrobacteraceae bacterium]|nr:hypothetical protein [Solirubrobacteraceae bacterium]
MSANGARSWMPITGYSDPWSATPGEPVRFYVSSDAPAYRAELVELIHGDTNEAGPGVKERRVESAIDGEHEGRRQAINAGSYVLVPDRRPLELSSFTLQCFI